MIPIILGVAALGALIFATSKSKKPQKFIHPGNSTNDSGYVRGRVNPKNDFSTMKKIALDKLPDKIRFFDDGKNIKTRQWEVYSNAKWKPVSEKEFDWLNLHGAGNDNIQYNRKAKSEAGKFVFYKKVV